MANRYLAVISPDAASSEVVADLVSKTGLACAFSAENLVVFSDAPADAVILPDGAGILIGHVFSRETAPKRLRSFSTQAFQTLQSTGGRALMKAVWGGYVAFIRSEDNNTTHVIRDPSGAMPCLFYEHSQGLIISSDLETLIASGLFRPDVDWSFAPRFLYAFDLRTSRTCLSGLNEVLAGARLNISPGGHHIDQVWSPWDHVQSDPTANASELAAHLEETITQCIRSWAGCFSHILLGVSGGLDSSIVAAALVGQHSTELTCLTMATDDAEGDERHFARLLTHSLNLPLVEAFHRFDMIDIERTTSSHLARPLLFAFGQSEHQLKFDLARERGIDGFFSGIGGDNVFCFLQSASPILDRLAEQGLKGAWETMGDVCQLTKCSLWEAMVMAVKRASVGPKFLWRGDDRFLAADLMLQATETLNHPWLEAPSGALPGKAAHISQLVRIQGTIDGFSRMTVAPQINPLLSQPIVEACLRIPSWRWCAGGANRAVARQAFRGKLPEALLRRLSKGGPNGFAFEVIDSHRASIRDRLLNGHLAQRHILDRPSLEAVLAPGTAIRAPDHMRLAALAEFEAWVDRWSGLAPGA